MSVKLLQQLYASFAKPFRAKRVNLPPQTFTRGGYAGLRKHNFCVNAHLHTVHPTDDVITVSVTWEDILWQIV